MSHPMQTSHPHIVRREGVCGGEPTIDGLRISVRHVAKLHLLGNPVPEIAGALNLTEAQVFHALSYYHDNREEIDDLIDQDDRAHDEYAGR